MVKSRPEILEKPRLVDSTSFYILSVFLFLARDVRALTVHGPSSAGVERSSISICRKTVYFCVMLGLVLDSKGLKRFTFSMGCRTRLVGSSTKTGFLVFCRVVESSIGVERALSPGRRWRLGVGDFEFLL